MDRNLKRAIQSLKIAGIKEGTKEYETKLRTEKVALCKSSKNVDSCNHCAYFSDCTLIKNHLRDLYGLEPLKGHTNE